MNVKEFKEQIKKQLKIDVDDFEFIAVYDEKNLKKLLNADVKKLSIFLKEINETISAINEHKNELEYLRSFWNKRVGNSRNRRAFEREHDSDEDYCSEYFSELLCINLVIDVYCSNSYVYTRFKRIIKVDDEDYNLKGADFRTYQKELKNLRKIVEFLITEKQNINKAA